MSFFSREKVFDHCAENFGDLEIFEDDAGILDTVANHNIRFRASNNGFLSSKLPRAATIAAAGVPPCYRRAIAATKPCHHRATGPPGHRRAAAASVAPSGRPDVRSIFDDIKIDLRNMLSLAIYDFKDKIIARCDTSIN